jgi:uncharacterized membrane protein YebE (DUF533 family)
MPSFDSTAVVQRYGRQPKSDAEALSYLKALKVIVSADGTLADAEAKALYKGLDRIGTSAQLKKDIESFTTKGVKLDAVIPKFKPGGLRARMLLRDAVEICRADGHYAAKEKAAVAKAAQLLGVDEVTIKAIETLVELEHAAKHLSKALFPKKK